MGSTPRLRMFAGPNGSGKSTLKDYLAPSLLGVYVNADEIEKSLKADSVIDLAGFGISATQAELQAFLADSGLLARQGRLEEAKALRLEGGVLQFGNITPDSYYAAVLADFVRQKLLDAGVTFTFETVMSFPDKVALLQKAHEKGFRTYLYFVATEDPLINIDRVRHRVENGGHPVDEAKIVSRYGKSLELLFDAVMQSDRAYIFDNSKKDQESIPLIAEVTDGVELEMKTDEMPAWFKTALWDKFEEGAAGDISEPT